ncbi:hypothetical protein PEL8287_02862 [Roseovarius litorisediminis]|uniref:Uncharacterized protein n=1 Tax=Roseovarius litorisediminis TaxID=1312363 RepID=A0A1Y5T181_9RHOB|nr:hypothetical protein [Roseovarius litorisediminis]SLN53849.1 hypothetical protein PEL8287_02862 [Roseovarius litorisediminis]
MIESASSNNSTARNAFRIAGLITLAFVGFVAYLMASEICTSSFVFLKNCQSRWSYFWEAPPNEIGDALAGVASGLALIWVVASVIIQRLELSSTVDELRASRQIEINRNALREYQIALGEFSDAFFSATSPEVMYGEWAYKPLNQDHLEHVVIRSTPDRKTDDDEFNLGVACAMITKNISKIFGNSDVLTSKPSLHLKHQQLLLSVMRLEELRNRLPYREANKLKAMKLNEAKTLLEKLLAQDELFAEKGDGK